MVSPNVMAIKQSKWKATATAEQRKLLSSPSCKLAGSSSPLRTRTRGRRVPFARLLAGRNVRTNDNNSTTTNSAASLSPKTTPRNLFCCTTSTGTTLSALTTDSSLLSNQSTRRKPPESRVIVEVNPLKEIMERHMRCPKCKASVNVSFPTKCIATSIRVDCSDEMCGFVDVEKPAAAVPELPGDAGSNLIGRNSDFAVNILYVLSFVSKGNGGTEAAHLLGLLGLPNSTTMDGSSNGSIECQIGPSVIQKLADDLVYGRNLVEEVKLFYKDATYADPDNEYAGQLLITLWQDGKLINKPHLWPKLTLSADMGWQGRSSGMQFNSLSGDAILVGSLTRKPCAWYICSRSCSFCKGWKRGTRKDEATPEHNCRKNWEGSAGAMEPVAILEM